MATEIKVPSHEELLNVPISSIIDGWPIHGGEELELFVLFEGVRHAVIIPIPLSDLVGQPYPAQADLKNHPIAAIRSGWLRKDGKYLRLMVNNNGVLMELSIPISKT